MFLFVLKRAMKDAKVLMCWFLTAKISVFADIE